MPGTPSAQASPLPWWPFPGAVLAPPPAALGFFEPVNVHGLLAAAARSHALVREVAPGQWVTFARFRGDPMRLAVPYDRRAHGRVAGVAPLQVDHRQGNLEGPVRNQGSVGSCTGVSLAAAVDHALRTQGVIEPSSSIHLWSRYGVPYMGRAGDSNMNVATASDSVWIYSGKEACKLAHDDDSCGGAYSVTPGSGGSDPQVQANKGRADQAGLHAITKVETLRPYDPDVLVEVLAGGSDVWAGFNVDSSAWSSSSMNDHVIPDYQSVNGGHAVVLSGYRTVAGGMRQFLIHNSWGLGWGDGGYAWISETMVRQQMDEAYLVTVGGGPTPPVGPSGSCPAGQVPDSVLGTCAAACSGGTAPAAGICVPGGFPGVPGAPSPGPSPAPGGCPNGQVKDALTGQCVSTCPSGRPPLAGACLPL